jgi:hypothetical protein
VSTRKPAPGPTYPSGPRGHNYCWKQDPKTGVRCCQPAGHEEDGVEHLHPYVTPNVRWP